MEKWQEAENSVNKKKGNYFHFESHRLKKKSMEKYEAPNWKIQTPLPDVFLTNTGLQKNC